MKKTKDQVQNEAIEALNAVGGSGIICMATGTGKSRIPIMIADRELDLHYSIGESVASDYKILICVPTEKLRDVNWSKEFEKWGVTHIWEKCVERTCYVSMPKIEGQVFDLVVLDECHNITEYNSGFFKQNVCKRVIGLTATMPDNVKKLHILESLNLNIVYTVTMDEAVGWGLVSPYQITVIKVPIEKILKTATGGTKGKPFAVTEFNAYWYLTDKINEIKDQIEKAKDDSLITSLELRMARDEFISNLPIILEKKKMYERKRMHLVYNFQSKMNAAKYLLNHMSRQRKTLIFAGSIDQAEQLCVNSFHSATPKKSTVYQDFLDSKITWMSCVNALNEGHNIDDLDTELIVQLNSKSLGMVQRIGRSVRFREGHTAKIIILVSTGTVDEDWSKTALSTFGEENINTINFEEIVKQHEIKS
jgi:superfamily II DNA or RNA helicase